MSTEVSQVVQTGRPHLRLMDRILLPDGAKGWVTTLPPKHTSWHIKITTPGSYDGVWANSADDYVLLRTKETLTGKRRRVHAHPYHLARRPRAALRVRLPARRHPLRSMP